MTLLHMGFILIVITLTLAAIGLGAALTLLAVAVAADITQRARGTGLSTFGQILQPKPKAIKPVDPFASAFGPPEPQPLDPAFIAAARRMETELIASGRDSEVP